MSNCAKLSEIASIQSGIYAKPNPMGEVYYIQSRHFDNDHQFDYSTKPELAHKPYFEKHLLIEGDIVIATKGNHFYAVLYKGVVKPAVASSTFMVIRIHNKAKYLPAFVAWQLNSIKVQNKLNESAKGTSIPSLTKVALSEIELNLPDLIIQKQVIALEELNKRMKNIRGELNKLYDKKIEMQLINAVNK